MSVLSELESLLPSEEFKSFVDSDLDHVSTLNSLATSFGHITIEHKGYVLIHDIDSESPEPLYSVYLPESNPGYRLEIQDALRSYLDDCEKSCIWLHSSPDEVMWVATKSINFLIALYFHFLQKHHMYFSQLI